jgi:hypothetical protein
MTSEEQYRRWSSEKLSDAEMQILVDNREKISYACLTDQALKVIAHANEPATLAQQLYLKCLGFEGITEGMTKRQCGEEIKRLRPPKRPKPLGKIECPQGCDAGFYLVQKSPHVGAYCWNCKKWIRWIAAENIEEARSLASEVPPCLK